MKHTIPLLIFALLPGCRSEQQLKIHTGTSDTGEITFLDADGDGFSEDEDCDDTNALVNPDAGEICDGLDNNCDGTIDEDVGDVWYTDRDEDGWGNSEDTFLSCGDEPFSAPVGGDCDDNDADTYPDAPERCDEVDNDCDGEIDEDLLEQWYADADGDGHGDSEVTLYSCDPESGYVGDATDCDDRNAAISPVASELCDGVDNDCDGTVDEDDAVDAATFYADSDADGFGDADQATSACSVPSGFTEDDSDCDDNNAAIHPDAVETCDGLDNNCNGWIDDDDPDITGTTTWYLDYDGDSYGTAALSTEACDQPASYADNTDDCDDTEAAIHPAATEVCDGVDNDCDGDIDEDDAADAASWYADTDGDGYGDPNSPTSACEQPSGYVADNTDCDDSNDQVHPDRGESYDGLDNDCDGDIDEDLWMGTGDDGSLTVSTTTGLGTDAIAYTVIALSGASVGVNSAVSGISAGDEVLILNLQGTDGAHSAVGAYEFGTVDSVSVSGLLLVDALTETFGESSNTDLSDQVITVQRVPHYTDVTITSTGLLVPDTWNGTDGGVLAFRASGTVLVESGGAIATDDAGFAGGATGSTYNCDAFQGESYAGEGSGEGDGYCSSYNEYWGWYDPNYGGGGAHICGGGGAYDEGATDADSWTGGSATPAYAGEVYGDADLSTLFFGSGGGGVWYGSSSCVGSGPGSGGGGGGILYIGAHTIETEDSAAITSLGGSTDACAVGSWVYGAGGGAGGSVFLQAEETDLASDSIQATGGFGNSSNSRVGGDGGQGRVRIDCTTCNGFGQGSTGAEAALEDAADPDPGYSTTP